MFAGLERLCVCRPDVIGYSHEREREYVHLLTYPFFEIS